MFTETPQSLPKQTLSKLGRRRRPSCKAVVASIMRALQISGPHSSCSGDPVTAGHLWRKAAGLPEHGEARLLGDLRETVDRACCRLRTGLEGQTCAGSRHDASTTERCGTGRRCRRQLRDDGDRKDTAG